MISSPALIGVEAMTWSSEVPLLKEGRAEGEHEWRSCCVTGGVSLHINEDEGIVTHVSRDGVETTAYLTRRSVRCTCPLLVFWTFLRDGLRHRCQRNNDVYL